MIFAKTPLLLSEFSAFSMEKKKIISNMAIVRTVVSILTHVLCHPETVILQPFLS
jgi:hypothetical protein